MNGFEILQPECYELMWHPIQTTPYRPNKHYGLGWFLGEFSGLKIIGHGGREYGFNSIMLICPQFKITIAILINVHTAESLKLAVKILSIITAYAQRNLTMVYS